MDDIPNDLDDGSTDEALFDALGANTPEFLAAVAVGIAQADAGKLIPIEEVRRWVLSWGTDHELPPPECP